MFDLPEGIIKVVEQFPTNNLDLLHKDSYFRYVVNMIKDSSSFLEIGYRKGIFIEVCKYFQIPSVHIDISDELLRAQPTIDNQCYTTDSLSFLKSCDRSFDCIFQDGSKSQSVRMEDTIKTGQVSCRRLTLCRL
jgi:hypothetical protein